MTIYERRHNFTDPSNLWDNRLTFSIDVLNVTNPSLPVILDKRAGRLTASRISATNYINAEIEELKLVPCSFEQLEELEVADREVLIAAISQVGTIRCIEGMKELELSGI